MESAWQDIKPPDIDPTRITPLTIAHGRLIPPQQQIMQYSSAEWELFVEEWAHYCLKKEYQQVKRFSGAGDKGIDVAGFTDENSLNGIWDNYQCKHYANALRPTEIWVELGKVIWYTFRGDYKAPRKYFFVSPWGTGTKLTTLLGSAKKLRSELIENWDKYVKDQITAIQTVALDTALRAYVDKFDFSIFSAKTGLELTESHRQSPVYSIRFGGGLKPRPLADQPPAEIKTQENVYVTKLLAAYSQHSGSAINAVTDLSGHSKLKGHFQRQREAFYHAESLRVFARDSVPAGTFESLQGDIFDGVIDTHQASHTDGFSRVCAVTKAARDMQITANALISCTKPKDRDGICHQLANNGDLDKWI